jgi:hypothetical protein
VASIAGKWRNNLELIESQTFMKLSLTFNVRPLEKAKSTVLVAEYLLMEVTANSPAAEI